MAHVRFTNTLFLFTYSILVIKCVEGRLFCNPRMTYHRHSHSCMTVVNGARTHDEANQYCAQHFSGHLVYILDEETNNFTKFWLPDYDWYHIGLNDKDQDGVYKWGNGQVANFTDFQKQQISYEIMKYVIMYKGYWRETFDTRYKFICQTNAENKFFFLNRSDFENKTVETTAQTKAVWNCGVYVREEHKLELLYLKNDGTILHLRNVSGTDLKHEMTTDCNSSGVYICRITNKLTGKFSNLEGILKVKCDATNCSDTNSNIKLLVANHSGCTEGKFCLFMYPKYTQEKVHNERKVPIKKPKYSIAFTYTNEIDTKGELVIKFCNVTSSDYGGYVISLWNNVKIMSTLYFTITGPPQCPKNLTSVVLDHNLVKLTWSPISHKILKQTFIIFRTDKGGDVNISTVLEQNETLMSYNVTGLSVNINYSFFLQVESGQSKIECRNLTTIVLIQEKAEEAQVGQLFDDNTVFYIIPIVAFVVILAVIVVIIVLVKKRKKTNNKNTFTDQKGFKYNCGSETISTQQSSQNNDNFSANTLDPVCSTEVAENIYNNVLENKAQQGAKVLKPARKSGSSVKLKDKVSMATGKKQAATLPLGKTLVTWDDEKEDVNVYENAREDTLNQVQELEDKEYNDTPSNEKKLPLQEPDGETSKPREDSRTISPEGLVYVSVEINRSGPQILVEKPNVEEMLDKKQTQDKKQKEIVKAVEPSNEAVEYSSLDYVATSVAATKEDVGGRDTEELKNK